MDKKVETNFSSFKPRILAFLCNWCSYAGADMAGVSRIQYPANVRIIRVMCSGRVDPLFIVEGFLNKADGVMVLGCHPGDCHYISGNYEAINTIGAARMLIDYAGILEKRLVLDWVSASEGTRFRDLVDGFTRQIEATGPLGAAEGKSAEELDFNLKAARMTAESEKFRWVMSRQTDFMQAGNKYGERFTRHEMDRALEYVIVDTLKESKIRLALGEKPSSVEELAGRLALPAAEVLRLVVLLSKTGAVRVHKVEGNSVLYSLNEKESEISHGKVGISGRREPGRYPLGTGRV